MEQSKRSIREVNRKTSEALKHIRESAASKTLTRGMSSELSEAEREEMAADSASPSPPRRSPEPPTSFNCLIPEASSAKRRAISAGEATIFGVNGAGKEGAAGPAQYNREKGGLLNAVIRPSSSGSARCDVARKKILVTIWVGVETEMAHFITTIGIACK